MQTFLPDASFVRSALWLDKKRCWKQVIEARQILATLGVNVPKIGSRGCIRPSHVNHPIHKMWRGYETALMFYHDIFLSVAQTKWKVKAFPLYFCTAKYALRDWCCLGHYETPRSQFDMSMPWFIGYQKFHDAHKSNLLRKDPEWYGQYGWDVPDDLEYIWMELDAVEG